MFRRFFSVLLGLLALTAAAAALAESFYLPGTYTATAQGCGGRPLRWMPSPARP